MRSNIAPKSYLEPERPTLLDDAHDAGVDGTQCGAVCLLLVVAIIAREYV